MDVIEGIVCYSPPAPTGEKMVRADTHWTYPVYDIFNTVPEEWGKLRGG